MKALQYKPKALWRLDDTAPFQDYSGYSRSGTLSGTENHGVALTSDAAYSQVFSPTTTGTFAVPVYQRGQELNDFSLSAVVLNISRSTDTSSVPQQILSKSGYDGLSINGRTVSFSTAYLNSGEAKCSYELDTAKKVSVVGTHSATKNSLYVNGLLVAEVDISPAQQADVYASTDANMYSGNSASARGLLVNELAAYGRALSSEDVASLYRNNSIRAEGSIPKMFGGEDVLVSSAVRLPTIRTGWFNDEDWATGNRVNASIENGDLVAAMENTLTLAGTWIDAVDLYTGPTPVPLTSMNLWWSGENVTIEVSIDAITWTPAVKGQNLSIITNGFDPTAKALYVRATFTAGQEEAYLEYIRVHGYTTNTASANNRTITYSTGVVPLEERVPFEFQDDWGARIPSGGTITIGPDTSGTPSVVRTIEVWYKTDTATAANFGTTATSTYQNGAGATATLPDGQWVLYHRVLSADLTGSFTLDVPGQIGKVAVYDTALTAAQVAAIYANYTGVNKTRYDMTGNVALTEPAAPALVYAHDWEITAA